MEGIIDFTEKSFASLMIPIHKLPEGEDAVRFFKKLDKHPEFNLKLPHLHRTNVVRYIVLMYDSTTPFKDRYADLGERKIEVAKYIGFNVDSNGSFNTHVKKMLTGENLKVNRMILAYCRMQRSYKYSTLVGLDERFYKELGKMISGKTPSRVSLVEIEKQIEDVSKQFYNEDNNVLLKDTLFETMEQERLDRLTPEGIAEAIQEEREPVEEKEAFEEYDDHN
jgi:hypothetical protein